MLSSDPILDDAPVLGPGLGLDASSIDTNLRSIRQVERSWRLPALPDEVRLDLAGNPSIGSGNLSSFLAGIDRDVHGENDEDPAPPVPVIPRFNLGGSIRPATEIERSSFENATDLISSLRGRPRSEVLAGDAVQRWKMQAIERGQLEAPAGATIDGTWSPELSGLRKDLAYEEYDSRMRGDRFGAMPIGGENGVLKLLNDWTSPSGLLRAAVDLDLWWDAGQIDKEWSSWGDKWRKVGDSDGVLDFGKNLFDALTGPIDDIAVPILNMALLFSGVGAGVNFARLGVTGLKAGQAVQSFRAANALYRVPKAGALINRIFPALNTGEAAFEAAQGLARGSMLAGRLQKGGTVASAVGDSMAAWRALPSVVTARRGVQTGMRLGFTSQVEDLLPSYAGKSLGDTEPGARLGDRAFRNVGVQTFGEVLFTPYAMFEPGTFVRGGQDLVRGTFKLFGTAGGRAAVGAVVGAGAGAAEGDLPEVFEGAAIGGGVGLAAPKIGSALSAAGGLNLQGRGVPILSKTVGEVGAFLKLTSYTPIGQDQRATALFATALERNLGPEAWEPFRANMASKGFLSAFAGHLGTDVEGAGAAMHFTLLQAAIHHTASQQAGAAGSKGWRLRYWLARNKLTSQLRVFDPTTTKKDDVVWGIVTMESASRRGLRRRFDQAMDGFDEATIAETIALHNEQASLTMRQLLSPENLPIDGLGERALNVLGSAGTTGADERYAAMGEYISTALDSFGDWGKFTSSTSALRQTIGMGILENVRLVGPRSSAGRALNQLEVLDDFADPIDPSKVDWAQGLNDTLFLPDGVPVEKWRTAGGYHNPHAREIDPNRSRFTVARAGTVTKHQFVEQAHRIKETLRMMDDWRDAARIMTPTGDRVIDTVRVGNNSGAELAQALATSGVTKGEQVNLFQRLNRVVRDSGMSLDDGLEMGIHRYSADMANDPRWSEIYKIDQKMTGADGKVLSGRDLLEGRRKALYEQAKYTAAEADVKGLIDDLEAAGRSAEAADLKNMVEHLDGQGYKVVYGQDFLQPDELLNKTGLFADINERHMNAMTLGNFFGRKQPAVLAAKVQRYRMIGIARELGRARGRELDPNSTEVAEITRDLYDHVLTPAIETNSRIMDDVAHMSILTKATTAASQADSPRSLQDLGLGKNRSMITSKLVSLGYSESDAAAVWQGLKAGRFADWSDQGLYAIEAKLRSKNQILDALHVLSGTDEGARLKGALTHGGAAGALVGAAGGAITAQSTSAMGEDPSRGDLLQGALVGAGIGVGVGAVAGLAAGRAASAMDYSKWARYGYVADNVAAMRDKLRFQLSPFFDLSRFTEAFALNQIAGPMRAADGTRTAIPFNSSPKKLRKLIGEGAFQRNVDEMRAASKGMFQPDQLESTDRWFKELGILGFNPTNWMSSSFYHMRQNGMDPTDAYEAVQKMYHYGTQGRSAAELSANFLFFPFSFQKKTVTHAAQFLADDMMRGVLLHDAVRAYQLLDENYDLDGWAEDHLPVLEKLQQLNLFAFGLSPGRLGGINAPAVDFLIGDGPTARDPSKRGLLMNLFTPQAVFVPSEPGKRSEFETLIRRTIPVLNDVHHMLGDLKDQGNVVFSPSHKTRRAEITEGYAEWGQYKEGVTRAMKQAGASFYDLYNDPGLEPLLRQYQEKKLELETRLPAWRESRLKSAQRRVELEEERKYRVAAVTYSPETATKGDELFVQFEELLELEKARLAEQGVTDILDADPEFYSRMQGVGVEMARKSRDFEMIWKKFYERDLGPITTLVGY